VIGEPADHAPGRIPLGGIQGLGFRKLRTGGDREDGGCLKIFGTGATAKSILASRRPVKFHDPEIHIASFPARKASRGLAFAGVAILFFA